MPITLQTFGIFLCLEILGGYLGTVSVLVYVCLGIIGLPVFSGFSSGVAALFGVGGGYIIGFLGIALIYLLLEKVFTKKVADFVGLPVGLIVCYLLGALCYSGVYATDKSFIVTLVTFNAPYIIPDLIKLGLALLLGRKISAHLQKIK